MGRSAQLLVVVLVALAAVIVHNTIKSGPSFGPAFLQDFTTNNASTSSSLMELADRAFLDCPSTASVAPSSSSSSSSSAAAAAVTAVEDPCSRFISALQFETVSTLNDQYRTEFDKLKAFFRLKYPLVFSKLRHHDFNGTGLFFEWTGKDPSLKPIAMMSHFDVVPSQDPAAWKYPPFSGTIADGYIWARGTIDDKAGVVSMLEAAENLLHLGHQPRRTIYFVFGADEEIGGNMGASKAADWFIANKIELEMVLDEGGAHISGMVPGMTSAVSIIGIAEKGFLSLNLTVLTEGGHSSTPPRENTISILAKAIYLLQNNPMPASTTTGVARYFFDHIAPHAPWYLRVVLANQWLTSPLLKIALSRGPTTNAIMRTTIAPTIINAGFKDNVLPSTGWAVINFRIHPTDTIESVEAHVRRVVRDPRISISLANEKHHEEASSISCVHCKPYELVVHSVRQVMPDITIATPYLMLGASDSRYMRRITPNVYNYIPHRLNSELYKGIHGIDERISITNFLECVRFMQHFIINSDQL